MSRRLSGFTLIEMLIVLALLGVFVAIAAPNFASLIRSNKVQAAADELFALLQYTRAEAITRGLTVTLQASSATAWGSAVTITQGAQTLRRIDDSGVQRGVTVTAKAAAIAFTATGTAASQCFTFCASNDTSVQCRYVEVSGTGRITSPTTTQPASGECS